VEAHPSALGNRAEINADHETPAASRRAGSPSPPPETNRSPPGVQAIGLREQGHQARPKNRKAGPPRSSWRRPSTIMLILDSFNVADRDVLLPSAPGPYRSWRWPMAIPCCDLLEPENPWLRARPPHRRMRPISCKAREEGRDGSWAGALWTKTMQAISPNSMPPVCKVSVQTMVFTPPRQV